MWKHTVNLWRNKVWLAHYQVFTQEHSEQMTKTQSLKPKATEWFKHSRREISHDAIKHTLESQLHNGDRLPNTQITLSISPRDFAILHLLWPKWQSPFFAKLWRYSHWSNDFTGPFQCFISNTWSGALIQTSPGRHKSYTGNRLHPCHLGTPLPTSLTLMKYSYCLWSNRKLDWHSGTCDLWRKRKNEETWEWFCSGFRKRQTY